MNTDDAQDMPEEDFFVFPASFAQQRLWFLDQLEPGGYFYVIPAALRLKGSLHLEALKWSLNEIVRRHEVLRTTFAMVDEQLMQIVAPVSAEPLPLLLIDVRGCLENDREAEVQRLLSRDARQPFDLAGGPLLRCCLFHLDAEEYVFALTMHHIISDGWSMGVLVQELAAFYESFAAGRPSSLPELSLQYADYAIWQREWLQGEELARQLDYWKECLAGSAGMVDLATDRPRPAVQTFHGASQSILLPLELHTRLLELCLQEDATLFIGLLAVFQTLLYRYSMQEDIVIGTPIANRNRAELEELIGFFINTLVMRTSFVGMPNFRELLRQVREAALEAYAHQDIPFEQVVDALQPARDMSRSPLFQIMFVLQNTPSQPLKLGNLALQPLVVSNGVAKFDLTLSVIETAQGLLTSLEYNTDLYETATIGRMLAHFRNLLENVVAFPEQSVALLPLLSEEERERVVVEWNETRMEYERRGGVHERFEQWAQRRPEGLALWAADGQWSYGELEQQANQLARYLRRQGVGPEVLVGVCLERSGWLIVAELAVLKAGGAYVPLEPSLPTERLIWQVQDAQPALVLSRRGLREVLEAGGRPVVEVEDEEAEWRQEETGRVESGVGGEHLAYMIYTSGSTGRPKGVQIEHRGLSNLVNWHQQRYGVQPEDRGSQVAGMAFDASVWEIYL